MSTFINQLIFIIHGLFFDGKTEIERKLYEVRTRKILSYSNMVATSSNIAVIAVTRDLNKLDVGGAAVTIYRLITDRYFIKKVKEEFIFGSYRDMIRGNNDLSVGWVWGSVDKNNGRKLWWLHELPVDLTAVLSMFAMEDI